MNYISQRRYSSSYSHKPYSAFSSFFPPRCSLVNTPLSENLICTIEKLFTAQASIASVSDVTTAPGQTNEHFQISTFSGAKFLAKLSRVKTSTDDARARFNGERQSLEELRKYAPDILNVPECLGVSQLEDDTRCIALFPWADLVPFGASIPHVQRALGRAMAELHLNSSDDNTRDHALKCGFHCCTYLGSLPQENAWREDWLDFFLEQRLRPRLDAAIRRYSTFSEYGTSNETANALCVLGRYVLEHRDLRDIFFGEMKIIPSLLHGDLFMGNCGALRDTRMPAIFDPASNWGHSEQDLALSTLFGTFGYDFYDAYHVLLPQQNGFRNRQILYRLYYLLHMLVTHGAGFGRGGTVEDPGGYFELCCKHLAKLKEVLDSQSRR